MVKPVLLASLPMGDVDDVGVYAGFAIAEWEKSEVAQKLEKLNIKPQMWKTSTAPHTFGISVDLWCEEYEPEDMAIARLTGLLNQPFRAKI